jgi:hypothetical protein
MINNKPWIYGPYKNKYPPCPILYSQEYNKNIPSQKINIITTNLNLNLTSDNKKNIKKVKPWRQASVKSHELFIWDTKKLTII